MSYLKSKVIPTLKKLFDKSGTKKAAAAEAVKSFDESKDDISKEYEEKKTELQPKVVEIYGASSDKIKALVKEPKEAGLKKQAAGVNKFLDELAKIEFPGAKAVSEISTKFGPALVPGPVSFVFEKVAALIPAEEPKAVEKEPEPEPKPEPEAAPQAVETAAPPAEESTSKEKEVVVAEVETKPETSAPEPLPPAVEEKKTETADPPKA